MSKYAWCSRDGILHFGDQPPKDPDAVWACPDFMDQVIWEHKVKAQCRKTAAGQYLLRGATVASGNLVFAGAVRRFSQALERVFDAYLNPKDGTEHHKKAPAPVRERQTGRPPGLPERRYLGRSSEEESNSTLGTALGMVLVHEALSHHHSSPDPTPDPDPTPSSDWGGGGGDFGGGGASGDW